MAIMKTIYTYYKCGHANEIPIKEFNDEVIYLLKRGFNLFYFYLYGNEMLNLIASNTFIKLIGK